MRKIWEAIFLLIIAVTTFNIIGAAIQPYLPILGISVIVMIVIALGVLLFRLTISRRRF